MKIEHILKREGGTVIPMGGQSYHFAPDAEGRHVAEVTDPAHIERFLSIREGFCSVGPYEPAKPVSHTGGKGKKDAAPAVEGELFGD